MGLLADGVTMVADLQAEADGETVSYSRPGIMTPRSITAVVGTPEAVVDGNGNLPARAESDRFDFLFRSIDVLVALGLGVLPQKGDRIERTIGTRTYRYAVFADVATPAWVYGDPDQITVRVHARLAEVT